MKYVVYLTIIFFGEFSIAQKIKFIDSSTVEFDNTFYKLIETDSLYCDHGTYIEANKSKIESLINQNDLNSVGLYIREHSNKSNYILINKWTIQDRFLYELIFYFETKLISISQVNSNLILDPDGISISFYNVSNKYILRELNINNLQDSSTKVIILKQETNNFPSYNYFEFSKFESREYNKNKLDRKIKLQLISHILNHFIRNEIESKISSRIPNVIQGINFNCIK